MTGLLRHLIRGLHVVELYDLALPEQVAQRARARLDRYRERLDAWLAEPYVVQGSMLGDHQLVAIPPHVAERDLVERTETGLRLRQQHAPLWARAAMAPPPPEPEWQRLLRTWLQSPLEGKPQPSREMAQVLRFRRQGAR